MRSKYQYIYLNTYYHNLKYYYYVGSHVWNGEGLDPTYVGSSDYINKKLKWTPISIKILEVVDRSKSYKYTLSREAIWIDKFVKLYGVPPFAPNNAFTLKYKRPLGSCLNLWNNSTINAVEAARKSDVVRRRTKSQIEKYGKLPCHYAHNKSTSTKKAQGDYLCMAWNSPEVRRRVTDKLIDKGHYSDMAWNSPEVRAKMKECGIYQQASQKGSETKRLKKVKPQKNQVEVLYKGKRISGSVAFCCREIGHSEWSCGVAAKLRKHDSCTHHKILFRVIGPFIRNYYQ